MNEQGGAKRGTDAGPAQCKGSKCPGLGRRIMQFRRCKGWDRDSLAERLGVPPERLKKWELGANLPTVGAVALLAQTLEVTLDELVTGQAPLTPEFSPRQKDEAKRYLAGLMRLLKLQQKS